MKLLPAYPEASVVQERCHRRTTQGGGSDSFRSLSGAHPFTPEPLELRRRRSSGARISDALKGTKTCRNFKNRSHRLVARRKPSRPTRRDVHHTRSRLITLLWCLVAVALPEMPGRSGSS